jgi:hypothetical protein
MMMHGLTNLKFDYFLNTVTRLDFGMATVFHVRQEIDCYIFVTCGSGFN